MLWCLAHCTKDLADYPGLKVKDLYVGHGETVGAYSTIYVYYQGSFTDGKIFDRHVRPEQPRRYSMSANTLIEGWKVGLLGMKVGGKRRLEIPAAFAYGEKGKYGRIPPHAKLIFEVELMEVK
ncbi:MAG: FKBP-type peptidyl-prolyl cis-trans isomerase [Zetaproteobacteria bacterium]|nr:FKBP-type peptidyl-prolyl cis-trans isomerase [Zetaproteobacteria bacterium]